MLLCPMFYKGLQSPGNKQANGFGGQSMIHDEQSLKHYARAVVGCKEHERLHLGWYNLCILFMAGSYFQHTC